MATATTTPSVLDQKLSRSPGKWGMLIFGIVLVIGVGYAGHSLLHDLSFVHSESVMPFVLLGIALLVALGFEFVNGFHDTANAVATVIYTHSLEPHIAVVWSGFCKSAAKLVSPWSLRCSSPPSSGTSARGISDCPPPVRTPSSVR
jgi:PiT family inorganic phosphate transporter